MLGSFKQQSPTTSIRRPGSWAFYAASSTRRQIGSAICPLGTRQRAHTNDGVDRGPPKQLECSSYTMRRSAPYAASPSPRTLGCSIDGIELPIAPPRCSRWFRLQSQTTSTPSLVRRWYMPHPRPAAHPAHGPVPLATARLPAPTPKALLPRPTPDGYRKSTVFPPLSTAR